jgi:hypothetical protein
MTQSKNINIAYLKRILRRLEPEEAKIQKLVSEGELSEKGRDLAIQAIREDCQKLKAEIETLQKEI